MNKVSINTLTQSIDKIDAVPLITERNHDFDSLFVEAVYQKFNTAVIMDMQYIWGLYRKGFEEAQKAHFDMASYHFRKGDETIIKSNISDEVRMYLQIYITPKLSYYHYKKGDFAKAEELTWKALNETGLIEKEFPNMHMGKIQQLHNIVRVLNKQNKFEEAHHYECQILNYLMLHQVPDLPGVWHADLILASDPELVSLMIAQVLSEKVVNLLAIPEQDQQACLKFFASLATFEPVFGRDVFYGSFATTILAYTTYNTNAFIAGAENFFASASTRFNGYKHYLIFLYLTLIDPATLNQETEQRMLETLQLRIRVTPRMLTKYERQFQSMQQQIY